jgi:hypothetical protein
MSAIREVQEELFSAVRRPLVAGDVWCREGELRRERVAEHLRQIRHGLRVGHPVAVNPLKNLTGAESLVASSGEHLFKRRTIEVSEVGAAYRTRHRVSRNAGT